MPMNLAEQLEAVARRIQRRRLLAAACWALAGVIFAALVLIGADWLLGIYQRPGRLALTGVFLVAILAFVIRSLRSTRGNTSALAVALDLERREPKYQSLLASALEFSRQENNDPTAGSFNLRRAVVLRAALAAEELDLSQVVPTKPLRNAAIAALAAVMVLATIAIASPSALATGLSRLINPSSDRQWPRDHELKFVNAPSLIPTGSDFHAELRDRRDKLPASVTVQFRTRTNGYWHVESQSYEAGGDSLAITQPNVQQSFEYRARGGDDRTMPWQRVEAAPAPKIQWLKLTVHPPAYTGRAVEDLAEPWQVLAGSFLVVSGKTDHPIASAVLQTDGQPSVPLEVGDDRLSFRAPANKWQPKSTATWSLAFTTPEGMHAIADRRLPIAVQTDRPPTVEILSPVGEILATPDARIAFTVAATDDLAVRTLRLQLAPSTAAEGKLIPIELFHGSDKPEPGRREITYLLDLSQFAAKAGATWTAIAQAEDYLGQTAESVRPVRIRLVSQQELRRRFDEMTSRLFALVDRARLAQQQAADATSALESQAIPSATADQVAQLASQQRLVKEPIESGAPSAIELAGALTIEYERNNWPDQAARAQVQEVQSVLKNLAADDLPAIDARITTLARELPHATTDHTREFTALRESQQAVVAALESLLRDLSQSQEIQQHRRDLADLARDQTTLRQKTEEAARQSLARPPGESSTDEEQQAKQLSAEQRDLAARLAGAITRLRASAQSLATTKPAEAARLNDTATAAQESPVQAALNQAAEHLAARRFAQAAQQQAAAEQQLEALVNRLAASQRPDSAQRLNDLQQANQKLDALRQQNDKLAEAAEQNPTQQQSAAQSLADQTRKLADRLDQLRAAAAAKAASQAASALQKGNGSPASAQQAKTDFQKAQQELAAEQRREKTAQSKRQIEELNLALSKLLADQQLVVQAAIELQASQSTIQQTLKQEIAKRQEQVRSAVETQAEKIDELPVFQRLMRLSAATMKNAESKLTGGNNLDEAIQLAERAHSQLMQVADAVSLQARQQAQPPRAPAHGAKQNGGPNAPQDKSDQIQALQLAVSQLTLLRTMQEDLKVSTVLLEGENSTAADKKLAADQRRQLKELAGEQHDLSELAKSLMEEIDLTADNDMTDQPDAPPPHDATDSPPNK
jgi:hypothetical protein